MPPYQLIMNTMTIDIKDILSLLNLPIKTKSTNIECPFCKTYSMKAYPDGGAKCHNKICGWHGNGADLYAKVKGISKLEAYKELTPHTKTLIKKGNITFKQALDKVAEDLHFLANVRMYFAYYGNERKNQKFYQEKYKTSKKTFSFVINGNFEDVSFFKWNEIVTLLRQDINLESFKYDLKIGKKKFLQQINDDKKLEYIKKFTSK